MHKFSGNKPRSMDAKGRVPVPSEFRGALGEEVVIVEGTLNCLWVYPVAEYERFTDGLEGDELDYDLQDTLYQFLGSAEYLTLDSAGRVRVSDSLREYANLGKDVMMVGMGKTIHLWNREDFLAHRASVDRRDNIRRVSELRKQRALDN
ncbi:MAG: hypothetical protein LBJ07_02510 [Actinomycetes bacterium]|nr:hypothetical protein [Actinomycetes bacterium]